MEKCLKKECSYNTSRSSGPGGQHVNKTESRVELRWDMVNSLCLTGEQKYLLKERLGKRLTDQGVLILTCETHRSQHKNREEITGRFLKLITLNIKLPKKRKSTRPTRSSVEKRIKNKKIRSEIKRSRGYSHR